LRALPVALALLLLLLTACATGSPVGVTRDDPRNVQRELTESALTGSRPSARTRELLTRLGLRQRFERDPDGALADLRAGLAPTGDSERLFALAELSFLRNQQTSRPGDALAAAVYAYAFFFEPDTPPLEPLDPRVQIARHLYNRGLTRGLETGNGREVRVESRSYAVPFGTVDVQVAPGETRWVGWTLEQFVPAADLRVRGLQNRYRQAGIGAPLSASLGEAVGDAPLPGARFIPPSLKVPVSRPDTSPASSSSSRATSDRSSRSRARSCRSSARRARRWHTCSRALRSGTSASRAFGWATFCPRARNAS
jgi:hypothetical protein